MTKLEIPSIVVQNGSKSMERTVRTQRSLSKQDSIDEEREVVKFEDFSSDPQIEKQNSEEGHVGNTLHRSRSQNKVKLLVRSQAVREETSPPPDPHQNADQILANQPKDPSNAQNQQTSNRRHKLRREGSSSENWEHPPLSRGNSREQYDGGNQIDLHQFIIDTLNRNYKDRMLLLKIESELISLANDASRASFKFAQMSSYQRMLVHRVAAYYNMEHNVDTSGVSVIVNTTKFTQIPDTRFRDYVRDDLLFPEEPRRSILKRDSSSFDETGSYKSGERMLNGDSRRSKSFEEREEEYEKARRRIFNREHSGDGDVDCMDDLQWETDEGVCTQFDHSNRDRYQPRLLKVESYESGDTLRANSLRLSVSKSHSFNGYEPPQQQTRVLTKQDSGSSMSSRISPSSSGYKSQRSDATLSATPSPTATPNLHTQLSGQSGGALSPEPDTVVWAVTDLASVPPGSMLIHPQTGQPYTNADGTIYHYDPANPPRVASDIHQNGQQHCVPQIQAQPKHDALDNGAIISGNISSQQQQHGHEIGKSIIDSGYDSSGSGGYLAPPPQLCQAPHPQFQHQPNMIPPDSQSQYQPFVYPIQASGPPIPYQYDPRIQDGNPSSDLSSYMMGLSLDSTKPNDTRQIMYWQPQVQSQPGVPIYYNSGPANSRYQGPPPQSQICQTPQFIPQAPQTPQTAAPQQSSHIPPDHTGCYGTTYSGTGPECLPYAPQTLHMYYAPPYNSTGTASSGQNPTQATSGSGGYYSTNVPNCAGPILAVQYPQPCPHPTPPHTPQGVCSQFAVYNGCYSSHYSQSNSTLPVPQLFRKQALQVGVRCNSPMRPQYPASPSVKDRSQDDKMQPVPVYGFRVLPGDMRLLGNTGRGIPFALPTPSKAPHARKHRSKIGSNQGRNNGQHSIEVTPLHTASKA